MEKTAMTDDKTRWDDQTIYDNKVADEPRPASVSDAVDEAKPRDPDERSAPHRNKPDVNTKVHTQKARDPRAMSKSCSYIRDISVQVASSLVGAVVVAVVFFLFSDFVFKPPNLNGKWLVATAVERTAYTSYEGMIVLFEIVLYQEGDRVSGTAEKLAEFANGSMRVYEPAKRTRAEIAGAIDRNYLTKDRLNIHWVEHGDERVSSTFFEILRFDDSHMVGTFDSTAARSSGTAEWGRSIDLFDRVAVSSLPQIEDLVAPDKP
jgi:hypothetical protein